VSCDNYDFGDLFFECVCARACVLGCVLIM